MLSLNFDDRDLVPAIVQHARSGEVLMLGYMNQQALAQTLETKLVTFWSRSRGELWQKGATSGNVLRLVEVRADCDTDALLILAEPAGPTCHTGTRSCFSQALDSTEQRRPAPPAAFLAQLTDLIKQRQRELPAGSYTTSLFEAGVDTICKKIGEEAAEVIIAAKNAAPAELTYELADLLYHSLVLLVQQGLEPEAVWEELRQRHT